MKFFLSVLLSVSVWLGCCQAWSGTVVFEDEFNGNSLDLSKWQYQEGCGTDYGSGNLHCYTRNNVQVANGLLTIEARKERMEDKDFTSGRIRQTGEGFVYGAYVVRARMARGDHLWPGLWTLPINNECRYEEIDIAEYRGQPGESHSLETAAHWGRSWDRLSSKGIKHVGLPFDLSQDFHEYALLWLPSKMEWYIDDELYYSVSLEDGFFNSDPEKLPCRGSSTPFDEPTNFIFNLAVGGPFFEDFPNFDPLTWAKPNLELDWVRIYQE